MPKYGYIVVEGPHDVEFVYGLLRPFGLKRVQWKNDLDKIMSRLVPIKFPPDGDLLKRVPVPLFLISDSHVIAVRSAIGDTRLVDTLQEGVDRIELFTGVGVILDTDREIPATNRYAAIKKGLLAKGFVLPDSPGDITAGSPRIGAFVLPDNSSDGNLEDLLIECAEAVYPHVLASARSHVAAAMQDATLEKGDGEDLTKTPIRNKAIAGTVANVLRPGKAIQASIQDNKWLRGDNLKIGRIKAVQDFLVKLFELT